MKTLLNLLLIFIIYNIQHNFLISQTSFKNDIYGFKGVVSDNWKVYSQIDDDPINLDSRYIWQLPAVYSKLEKTSIENAVFLKAYERSSIKNIEDLKKYEFDKYKKIYEISLVDSIPYKSYVALTLVNGLVYKNKFVFIITNGLSYIIQFSSTPGTFDINISKFDEFVKNIIFFRPIKHIRKDLDSKIRFDGVYVAKTNEVIFGNKEMYIYNYLKFERNGTVYTQSVNSLNPKEVAKWLGKNGSFERKGAYNLEEKEISFTVSNDESKDKELEGTITDEYMGVIKPNILLLNVILNNGESDIFKFEFYPTE